MKDQLRFEIDQLRKDKIIFALESISVSMLCLVIYLSSASMFDGPSMRLMTYVAFFVPLIYFLYMVLQNTQRKKKIIELEKYA